MSASGPGSKFGAEYDAAEGRDRAGDSPAPASPPSHKRLKIVLEHNRSMLKELLAEKSDFTFPAVYAAEIETIRACEYLDGFVKGLEYALGIKPKK